MIQYLPTKYRKNALFTTALFALLLLSSLAIGQANSTTYPAGTHTFEVPAGVTEITVEVWGAGGGGGGSSQNNRGGSGGGGGGYAMNVFSVTSGDDIIFSVGAGGAAGAANGGNGSTGGTTTFPLTGYSSLIATGGTGGGGNAGTPGQGGSSTGGISLISGSNGTQGANSGGNGGAGANGGAGGTGNTDDAGGNGTIPGGGGGGGERYDGWWGWGAQNFAGGAGANGQVTITWNTPALVRPELVYWLHGDVGVIGTTPITLWTDQSANNNDASPTGTGAPDQITSAAMNSHEVLAFDGTDALGINNDGRINNGAGYNGDQRTMFVAFKTGADINTTQYIYEQGGGTNGIGVFIKNGNLYVTIYNDGNTNNRVTVFESVSANTPYIFSFNWNNGALSALLNNVSFSNQTSNGTITSIKNHGGAISIGFTDANSRNEDGVNHSSGNYFTGEIAEMIYYDASLNEEDELNITLDLMDRYGIVSPPVTTYFSYKPGNWNEISTWTHDPGGTTQTATDVPGNGAKVVVLSGRTVTLTENIVATDIDLTIRDGGMLDQSTFQFNNALAALTGDGTFKLASVNYPVVTTNNFVEAGGGTTEYYNTANFTLPAAQTEYNHLRINSSGVTATQLSNITLNGNLHVKQGTYQINNTNIALWQLTINGNVLVDNGASITTGTGNTVSNNTSGGTAPFTNYYALNSHRVVVKGDFTNNGTVRFTNQDYPQYNAFPTNGMATVYFMGSTNNTLTCNGTTDFYNLVVDKGIDKTYKLSVYSTAYHNFRLFGRNNLGGESGGDNPDLRKALWIRTGTLALTGLTVIPSLAEADTGGNPNGDFYIPVNAALHMVGPEVIVLTTADTYQEVNLAYGVSAPSDNAMGVRTTAGTSSFSIYGKLQIDNGYFSTRESGGIITWDFAAGELIINNGIVDAKQYRAAGSNSGLASYTQNGGEFILRGRFRRTPAAYASIENLKDFSSSTLNTNREAGGLNGTLGTFNLNRAENVFAMSGGTIRIYDVCGTAENEAFQVFSSAANNNVTGGTLEIVPTTGTGTGTNAAVYKIETTANIGNLIINRSGGTATVDISTYPLTVLNNATITSGALRANNFDLSIGGNFTLASGTSYTTGTNTTTFNGSNDQLFTNNSTPITPNNLTLNNGAGNKLTLSGSQATLNISNNLAIQKGELADNGKTINVSGNIFNADLHAGDGKIVLNGTTVQTIDGGGAFQNLELNNNNAAAAPISLIADATINGTLTFSRDKLLNIANHNLTLGASATVANAGATRFIQTAGNGGDGGVTRIYSSTTALNFPIGVLNYTPASIGLNSAPTTYGAITVKPVNYEHPVVTVSGRSLTYFWKVKETGFDLGSATVNHAYTYANANLVTGGNVSEAGYIAAMYDNTAYTWTKYATTDVNESTNTIGGAGTALADVGYIDGEFTAGDNTPTDPFGEPDKFYSVNSGLWRNASTWSNTSGGAGGAGVPDQNDIVIIENNHTVTLSRIQNCASLEIKSGSVLDIQLHTGSNFARVMSSTDGNGLFRLKTTNATNANPVRLFSFPSGDFSDFNVNQGTTEFYTTTNNYFYYYILPANITSYGNLILSPGTDNLALPNNSYTNIFGDLTLNSTDAAAWTTMSWNRAGFYNPTIEKTVHVHGNFYVNGGSFVFMDDYEPQHLVVDGNIEISSSDEANIFVHDRNAWPAWSIGGTTQSNTITVGGNVVNNSATGDARYPGLMLNYDGSHYCDITFTGDGTSYLTNSGGNPTTVFRNVTIDKGSDQTSELIVDIEGTLTTPTDNWLTLVNGTLKYLHNANFTITEQSEFTIPSTAGLYVNSPGNTIYLANANSNDNDVYLNGKLTIIDGDVYVGQSGAPNNNNDIQYSGGGDSEIDIQGGSLTVNGQIRRNPSTSAGILRYKQSGGNVTINGRNANTGNAKFEVLNDGSVFNMSGGNLTILRGGGGETFGDLYLRPHSSVVTGGTINFNADNADQDYIFDATVPIWNLTINGTNSANVKLLVSPLTIKNNLLIESLGALDANVNFDIPITIKGDFTNNGTYTHQKNLTTFSGGEQTISGTSDISFFDALIKPITSLTLSSNATVNQDLNLASGTLFCGDNLVFVKGDVTNNANYTDNAAGIILNGLENQTIQGTGTWGQLELNNLYGARLGSEITLQNDFILTKGIFDINSKLLTLGENSNIEGSGFGPSKMIASDGVYSDVGIRKYFSTYSGAEQTFTYPMGTSGKYTPAVLTYTDNTSVGYIRLNNINSHHPGVIDPTNVLDYFWEIQSDGIEGFNGNIVLNYLEEDVILSGVNTEADYIAAALLLPGTSWTKSIDDVDEVNNKINFQFTNASSLSGEYTAGVDIALPNLVPEFTNINTGNWNDKDNWVQTGGDTYTLTGAPNGFIVTIKEGTTVTVNENYARTYRTKIGGKLEIAPAYYGHNLGTVTGSGTLYLEKGTFPAGRYTTFFDCANNATLEYGGSTDYTIIAGLYSELANLHFTGTGIRSLPNKDLTICKELLINGPTVDNSANNKKLTIQGAFERLGGTFSSGSGTGATVSFAGVSAQTIAGTLGNFTGTNAFNNFEIDNSAGLTINDNGAIEVKGNLILTDGNINTNSNATLTITNTQITCVPGSGKPTSFVNGPLTKRMNQGECFIFPIGKDGELGNKLRLSAVESGTLEWTAEYFNPNETYTSYNTPLSYVNSYDRWKISAPTGSKANVGIQWDENSDLTPANTQGGVTDMRVARYDEGLFVWNELSSTASGITSEVTTTSKITIPTSGFSQFTTACINTIKPRAKFTPSGPVCGTNGIPVSFSSSPALNYILSYTLDNVAQPDITITTTPFTLPTSTSGTYKLVSFTYDGNKTGAVDQSEVIAYKQPEIPNAGEDQSICGGTQADISGSLPSAGSVLWSITSGSGGSIVAPTSQTTIFNGTNGSGYTLNYTVDNGGCTASDQLRIDFPVLAAQPNEFIVASANVCQTESAVVYTVPNDATVSYNWAFDNDGNWANGDDNLLITGFGNSISADFSTVAANGTLQVVASNACGESSPRAINIAIHPMPVVTLTDDAANDAVCTNSTVTFTATSDIMGSSFDFIVNGTSAQSGTSTTYQPTLSADTEVQVIATSDKGCATTSSTTTISVGDRIWDGASSNNWSVSENWSCGDVPSSIDDIIIPNAPTRMPNITSNAACNSLAVKNGAVITLEGANSLDIYGNWSNEGVFIPNEGTVNIKGNAVISGSADLTFHNLVIDNGVTLTSSTNIVNITGNLTNNGAFMHNNGTITFIGSVAQSISGNFAGSNALNNVTIDNAQGINLTAGNKKINGTLTFTNGLLTSNSLLTLGQNATTNISVASGKTTSYVNGTLKKVIFGNSNEGFFFPIGDGSAYKPIGVSALANAGGTNTWTAEYSASAPTEHAIETGTEILRVSNKESWSITSSAGDAKVTLSWDDMYNGDIYVDNNELSSLRVAHLNNSSNWTTTNAGPTTGVGANFGTVTSGDVITFDGSKGGPELFTLGSTSSEFHPLPVELISFTGKDEDGRIKLNWTTATETNNDYFEIQHSTNAANFQTIGEVAGAGTSATPNNYRFVHYNSTNGINYYRLKQVDFDGNFETHQVISVLSENITLLNNQEFSVYPNPYTTGDLTIELDNIKPRSTITLTILSTTGAVVYHQNLVVPESRKFVNLDRLNELATGMYLINIRHNTNVITRRFIVY